MKSIGVTFDEPLLERLDRQPEVRERGRSAVLRTAVADYLAARTPESEDDCNCPNLSAVEPYIMEEDLDEAAELALAIWCESCRSSAEAARAATIRAREIAEMELEFTAQHLAAGEQGFAHWHVMAAFDASIAADVAVEETVKQSLDDGECSDILLSAQDAASEAEPEIRGAHLWRTVADSLAGEYSPAAPVAASIARALAEAELATSVAAEAYAVYGAAGPYICGECRQAEAEQLAAGSEEVQT